MGRHRAGAMIVERWARRVVEEELQRTVELHDDQSQPSMFDLRVGPADPPAIAIECVGAVDPIRVETWNVGPAKGAMRLALKGDWTEWDLRRQRTQRRWQGDPREIGRAHV